MIETNWKYVVAGLGIFLYAFFGYDPIPVESIGICVELLAMFIGVTLILKGFDKAWKDIYKSKNGRRVAVTVLFSIPLLLLWSMVYATLSASYDIVVHGWIIGLPPALFDPLCVPYEIVAIAVTALYIYVMKKY